MQCSNASSLLIVGMSSAGDWGMESPFLSGFSSLAWTSKLHHCGTEFDQRKKARVRKSEFRIKGASPTFAKSITETCGMSNWPCFDAQETSYFSKVALSTVKLLKIFKILLFSPRINLVNWSKNQLLALRLHFAFAVWMSNFYCWSEVTFMDFAV